MCKFLKVPRSLVYYHINNRQKANKTSKEEVKLVCCKIKMDRGGCGHFFEQIKQSIRVLVDTQLDS
jgi:hypothetical protein